jgi:hypothetical protein
VLEKVSGTCRGRTDGRRKKERERKGRGGQVRKDESTAASLKS